MDCCVKFLEDVTGESIDFIFKKGKTYELVSENEDCYFIKQPNSPKNKNWVCQFDKSCLGKIFAFN